VVESDLLRVAVAQLRWDGIVYTRVLDSGISGGNGPGPANGIKSETRRRSPHLSPLFDSALPSTHRPQLTSPHTTGRYSNHLSSPIIFATTSKMATVHPSRLGLVPGARQDRSRASAPVTAPSAPPSAAPSREEELRRQLLRRRERGDEEGNGAERSAGDERGSRGGDRDRDGPPGRRAGERVKRSGQAPSKWDERPDDRSKFLQSPTRDARSPGRRGYDDPPHVRRVDDKYDDRRDRRPSPSYRPMPPPPSREEAFISLDAGVPGHSTGTSDISKYGYGRERNDIPHGGAPPPWRYQGGGGPAGPPNRMGFSGQLDYERWVRRS
jgi:hypothetical protein